MHKQVIICGAGPCGLTFSYVLHQFGIANMVVEKHRGTSNHPKARGVNVRTMEFLRNWGLEEKVRKYELPQKIRKLLWMDELSGNVLAEIKQKDDYRFSPTVPCYVPQNYIEDAFVETLQSSQFSDVKFSTELLSFEKNDNCIVCHMLDKTSNEKFTVTCDYLIAAEGAHSRIRDTINIQMLGNPSLGIYLTIYARTDLSPWLSDKKAGVYTFANKNQTGRFLMAVDHKDQWVFGQRLSDKNTPITEDFCKSIIKSFVNDESLNIQIISSSIWDMAALNAEHYSDDRIFLIGDSAHRMPPTGGMGMNTGIASAYNLAWKIAYVLKGYADKSLLDTYETERQPVASLTIDWAQHNAKRLFNMVRAYHEDNLDLFYELIKDQERHMNHPGLDLGLIYRSAAIYDKEIVQADLDTYTPSSVPGMRAPHCEITIKEKKKSILELYQQNYVLLLSENAKITRDDLPIPNTYPVTTYRHKIDFDDVNNDYIKNYNANEFEAILVRPDGHIAWRK